MSSIGVDCAAPIAQYPTIVELLQCGKDAMGTEGDVVDFMTPHENIDWSECPLVESKPGVHSGAPVLRGTRMPVSAIVDNYEYGVSVAEISEQFEIPEDCIKEIVSYAQSHRIAHSVR